MYHDLDPRSYTSVCCPSGVNLSHFRLFGASLQKWTNLAKKRIRCLLSAVRFFLGHRSRRLQLPIVITRCPASVYPSSVRMSSVRQFTFSTSSPEPLDGFRWNLVGMKYSWYLTSVVVFWPDPPRGGAKIGHQGSPSSRNFFFRPEGYSNKPNA